MRKNKIIQEKIKYKKPVKSCGTALKEIIRIRNNEQAKIYYREKKLYALPRKGKGVKTKADLIRKEIKAIRKGAESTQYSLKKVRGYCDNYADTKKKSTALKSQITRLHKKSDKLPKNDIEGRKELQKKYFKYTSELSKIEKKLKDVLFNTNKELGFSIGQLGEYISKQQFQELKKNDEITEEEAGDIIEGQPALGRDYKDQVAELVDKYSEEKEGAEEEADFVIDLVDVFWQIWRDFDKNEVDKLSSYDKVIFEDLDGNVKYYKGTQGTLISIEAGNFWETAREGGSDVVVSKFRTIDGKKLKYKMELL